MNVSGIISVASLFFLGLNDAAPVDKSAVSRIVKIDNSRVEKIDFGFVTKSLEAMYERHLTGGERLIMKENDTKFIDELIAEVQKRDLTDKFLREVVRASQVEETETVIAAEKKRIEGVSIEARGAHDIWRTAKPEELREMILSAFQVAYEAIKAIGNAFMTAMNRCVLLAKPGMWHLSTSNACDGKESNEEGNNSNSESSDDAESKSSDNSNNESSDDSSSGPSESSSSIASDPSMDTSLGVSDFLYFLDLLNIF